MAEKLIAWHGDQAKKDFRMARVRAHRAADEIADAPRYRMLGRGTVPPVIIEWIFWRMELAINN